MIALLTILASGMAPAGGLGLQTAELYPGSTGGGHARIETQLGPVHGGALLTFLGQDDSVSRDGEPVTWYRTGRVKLLPMIGGLLDDGRVQFGLHLAGGPQLMWSSGGVRLPGAGVDTTRAHSAWTWNLYWAPTVRVRLWRDVSFQISALRPLFRDVASFELGFGVGWSPGLDGEEEADAPTARAPWRIDAGLSAGFRWEQHLGVGVAVEYRLRVPISFGVRTVLGLRPLFAHPEDAPPTWGADPDRPPTALLLLEPRVGYTIERGPFSISLYLVLAAATMDLTGTQAWSPGVAPVFLPVPVLRYRTGESLALWLSAGTELIRDPRYPLGVSVGASWTR